MNATEAKIIVEEYKSSGNHKGLEELYMSYQPYMYRQCMSILKNPLDSEDACVDIFLILRNKLKIHTIDNFPSWLFSLVRNHCLKKLRNNSRLLFTELKEIEEKSEIVENLDQLEERMARLPIAMEQLKDDQRWCLILFYLQGKTYNEIEQIRGYSFNKIKSSIQHGKKNLKKILSENEQRPI